MSPLDYVFVCMCAMFGVFAYRVYRVLGFDRVQCSARKVPLKYTRIRPTDKYTQTLPREIVMDIFYKFKGLQHPLVKDLQAAYEMAREQADDCGCDGDPFPWAIFERIDNWYGYARYKKGTCELGKLVANLGVGNHMERDYQYWRMPPPKYFGGVHYFQHYDV
jgi:hypothetical protein